ncbi:hypothetical protein Gotur_019113 [Gossypium turneri]
MTAPEYDWWTSELGKQIEKLEEENIQLGLDIDIQKLEAKKIRKGKNKAEKDLDSLKIDYKNLRLSMRTVGLGKTSKQWYCNFAIELKINLNKIEELKGKIEELEAVLQHCELRVKLFEMNNKHWKEQL